MGLGRHSQVKPLIQFLGVESANREMAVERFTGALTLGIADPQAPVRDRGVCGPRGHRVKVLSG